MTPEKPVHVQSVSLFELSIKDILIPSQVAGLKLEIMIRRTESYSPDFLLLKDHCKQIYGKVTDIPISLIAHKIVFCFIGLFYTDHKG